MFFSSNLRSWTTLGCLISRSKIFSDRWAGLKGSTSRGRAGRRLGGRERGRRGRGVNVRGEVSVC